MIIDITSKQMEITPAIRAHIEDRLYKLKKWQVQLINPHVVLSKESQLFVIDTTITTPKGLLVATAKHEDMYAGMNEILSKLERQLDKLLHKSTARRAEHSLKDAVINDPVV